MDGVLSLGGEHLDEETGMLSLEKKKFVPPDFFNKNKRSHVKKGDILVCKDGARTGKSAYCRELSVECCVNEHVFLIRAKQESLSQDFLFYFIFSTFFRRQVEKWAYGKKGQPGLNQKHFDKIVVPLFDSTTQACIVTEIEKKWDDRHSKGAKRKLVDDVFQDAGLYATE